jgi:hypothetical protein
MISPLKFRMAIQGLCFRHGIFWVSVRVLLISGVEQPVSRSTWTRQRFFLSQCIIISTIGRVPQKGTAVCEILVWSSMFGASKRGLFATMPHIDAEAVGCGRPWPSKNPPRHPCLGSKKAAFHSGRQLWMRQPSWSFCVAVCPRFLSHAPVW